MLSALLAIFSPCILQICFFLSLLIYASQILNLPFSPSHNTFKASSFQKNKNRSLCCRLTQKSPTLKISPRHTATQNMPDTNPATKLSSQILTLNNIATQSHSFRQPQKQKTKNKKPRNKCLVHTKKKCALPSLKKHIATVVCSTLTCSDTLRSLDNSCWYFYEINMK